MNKLEHFNNRRGSGSVSHKTTLIRQLDVREQFVYFHFGALELSIICNPSY
jgi:hypothetical protein